MTAISFHVNLADPVAYACRLLRKAAGAGARVVVVGEPEQLRELDQALNAKEFAILAGVSYSIARQWFRLPGFPAFRGFVFWSDFTDWRRKQIASGALVVPATAKALSSPVNTSLVPKLPAKAARLLSEA